MQWLIRLVTGRRHEGPTEESSVNREEDQQQRADAEAKLAETRRMMPQVNAVATNLRRIRQDNHFSARIADAFGRPHD